MLGSTQTLGGGRLTGPRALGEFIMMRPDVHLGVTGSLRDHIAEQRCGVSDSWLTRTTPADRRTPAASAHHVRFARHDLVGGTGGATRSAPRRERPSR